MADALDILISCPHLISSTSFESRFRPALRGDFPETKFTGRFGGRQGPLILRHICATIRNNFVGVEWGLDRHVTLIPVGGDQFENRPITVNRGAFGQCVGKTFF